MKKHEFSGVIRGFLCTFLGCKRGVTLVIKGVKKRCFWGHFGLLALIWKVLEGFESFWSHFEVTLKGSLRLWIILKHTLIMFRRLSSSFIKFHQVSYIIPNYSS
jgi:hypothetical protein